MRDFRVIQTRSGECGLICVAYILHSCRQNVDIHKLRAKYEVTGRGLTFRNIAQILGDYGMDVDVSDASSFKGKSLNYPSIVSWRGDHFVVALKGDDDEFEIFDPATGYLTISSSEFWASCKGFLFPEQHAGIRLPPAEHAVDRSQDSTPGSLKSILVAHRAALWGVLLVSFLIEICNLAAPQFVAHAIDKLIKANDYRTVIETFVLAYGVVTLSCFLLNRARSVVLVKLNVEMRFSWFDQVISHLVRLPYSYFQSRQTGETLSKLQSINALTQFYSGSLVEAALNGFFALCIFVALGVMNIGYVAICLASSVIYILMRSHFQPRVHDATHKSATATAKQEAYLFETVQVLRPLRVFGALSDRMDEWRDRLLVQANSDKALQRYLFDFRAYNALIFGIARLGTLCYGVFLAKDINAPIGAIVAALAYVDSANSRVASLADTFFGMKSMKVHRERIEDITKEPSQQVKEPLRNVDIAKPAIRFENVWFRYGTFDDWVIRDLNLTIKHGDLLVIDGPSGIGKSTLIKLMAGVLTPTSGAIYFYGKNIADFDVHEGLCSSVFQDDMLFAGTIKSNLAPGKVDVAEDRMTEVLRRCGLADFITSLPMGIETMLGEKGGSLSGGQVQRLLLARALYVDPSILLLDEATSHLDGGTEDFVFKAIREVRGTCVFASHSQSVALQADKILHVTSTSIELSERLGAANLRAVPATV